MSHAKLVLYNQEAMKKRPRLERQGMVDVVLSSFKVMLVLLENISEYVSGPYMLDVLPDRTKEFFYDRIGNKALPIAIILVDVPLEVIRRINSAVVAPGVAAEKFVPSTS
jgi:hypothetical protein